VDSPWAPKGEKNLLTIGETIWDLAGEQSLQVDHGLSQRRVATRGVIPQKCEDLNRMQKDDLVMWIRSKGFSAGKSLNKAEEILNLAGQQPPQSSPRPVGSSKLLKRGRAPESVRISV
jgi:hypothetical protein